MGRPRKPRQCSCPHQLPFERVFTPAGIPLGEMAVTTLYHDELEVLHLCDGEGLTQAEAGDQMGVSRGTVQRILADARKKVAKALVDLHALAIKNIET